MKIISHRVLQMGAKHKIFELRIRTGVFFYDYKTIKVHFLFNFKFSPNIDGLTPLEKFIYEFKIWDYCQDVYEKINSEKLGRNRQDETLS